MVHSGKERSMAEGDMGSGQGKEEGGEGGDKEQLEAAVSSSACFFWREVARIPISFRSLVAFEKGYVFNIQLSFCVPILSALFLSVIVFMGEDT